MRVLCRRPLLLHPDVAVAAAGLFRRDREVTEESVDTVGGWIEGWPVAVDDLVVGTRAEREQHKGTDGEACNFHGFLPAAMLHVIEHSSERAVFMGVTQLSADRATGRTSALSSVAAPASESCSAPCARTPSANRRSSARADRAARDNGCRSRRTPRDHGPRAASRRSPSKHLP